MFFALDGTGSKIAFSTTQDSQGSQVGSSAITDPITGAKLQVGTQYANDNQNFTGNALLGTTAGLDWNGQSFDRHRNNIDAQSSVVTINGASAQTIDSANMTNYNHRGAQIGVNITQISASTTVQFAIQGLDVASGQWYTLLTSATFSTVGFTLLTVYPGATVTSNVSVSTPLPRTWRVVATISGAGTVTATVGVSAIM